MMPLVAFKHPTRGSFVKRRFVTFLLVSVASIAPLFGQKVGDSEQKVREALGSPSIEMDRGARRIWVYTDGSKVIFERGLVVSSTAQMPVVAPAQPLAQSATSVPSKPTSQETSPTKGVIRTEHSSPSRKLGNMPPAFERPPNFVTGGALLLIGALVSLVCGIIIIVEAFRAGVFWGLAVLFLPIVELLFVATHWTETKKPFLLSMLVGTPLMIGGYFIAGGFPR